MLAVEKPIHSRLLKPQSNRRIHNVELHAGLAGAGLVADCRALAQRAREECAAYRENLGNVEMPGATLAERVALYMQAYTMYGSVRPFCSNVLLAALDADGPHLYMLEPSGVFWVLALSPLRRNAVGISGMRGGKGTTNGSDRNRKVGPGQHVRGTGRH